MILETYYQGKENHFFGPLVTFCHYVCFVEVTEVCLFEVTSSQKASPRALSGIFGFRSILSHDILA